MVSQHDDSQVSNTSTSKDMVPPHDAAHEEVPELAVAEHGAEETEWDSASFPSVDDVSRIHDSILLQYTY